MSIYIALRHAPGGSGGGQLPVGDVAGRAHGHLLVLMINMNIQIQLIIIINKQ